MQNEKNIKNRAQPLIIIVNQYFQQIVLHYMCIQQTYTAIITFTYVPLIRSTLN